MGIPMHEITEIIRSVFQCKSRTDINEPIKLLRLGGDLLDGFDENELSKLFRLIRDTLPTDAIIVALDVHDHAVLWYAPSVGSFIDEWMLAISSETYPLLREGDKFPELRAVFKDERDENGKIINTICRIGDILCDDELCLRVECMRCNPDQNPSPTNNGYLLPDIVDSSTPVKNKPLLTVIDPSEIFKGGLAADSYELEAAPRRRYTIKIPKNTHILSIPKDKEDEEFVTIIIEPKET